ncbi:MAG: polyhydroxyalkanoate synthesis regulator DNA-binding domain-containing protein [Isosphaeraceae bacterium]
MNNETKVQIRRYPNRRLYDRSRRQYVTLKDIEDLVLEGKTVEVSDSRTGDDMTRHILTQILMDRHPRKMDMFPVAMLHSVLRANDFAMDLWGGYLRQSLAAMEAWQKAASPFATPMDWVSTFFPGFAPPAPASGANPGATSASPTPSQDPVAMRIEELSRRIDRLESGEEAPPSDGSIPEEEAVERLEDRVEQLEGRKASRRGRKRDSVGH